MISSLMIDSMILDIWDVRLTHSCMQSPVHRSFGRVKVVVDG